MRGPQNEPLNELTSCCPSGNEEELFACIKHVFSGFRETALVLSPDGKIKHANLSMLNSSGYENPGELPEYYFDLLGPENDSSKIEGLRKSLASGNPWKGNLWKKRKESSAFEAEVSAAPFYCRGHRENAAGFIVIERDLTADRKLEQQIRQKQKMEAIGTLAGGIAHDFNNILAAIMGFTELAMLNALPGSEQAANLDEVMTAGHRARDLVKQLLIFSRQERKQGLPLQVRPIISEALNLLRSSIPSNIEIRRNMASNSAIFCDPVDLHQVLVNLCSNAALAMAGRGGVMTVDIRDVDLGHSDPGRPRGLPPGVYLTMSVSDTGTGMAPETVDRVFEPFFTTRPEGEGSGMGLAVVHGIVTQAGGTITVESEPGKGSVFTAFFPVHKEQPEKNFVNLEDLPRGSERIMVVDDEVSQLLLAKKALGSLGYAVETYGDPANALEEFRKRPGDYDLAITDMTMPGMSGIELAREMKAVKPGMPVILTTGYCQMVEEKAAPKIGVDAILAKPVVLITMAKTIREVLKS